MKHSIDVGEIRTVTLADSKKLQIGWKRRHTSSTFNFTKEGKAEEFYDIIKTGMSTPGKVVFEIVCDDWYNNVL